MPNLYKQYFVHNEPDKTRVINSNDIVEKRLEKMAELKRMEQKQQTEMVSQQGSLVLTQIMWRRSTILQKQKEAEKILAEAHAQAETILSQADQEAENIRENAKIPDIRREDSAWRVSWRHSVNSYRMNIRENRKRFRMNSGRNKNMEKDLVDVILEVLTKYSIFSLIIKTHSDVSH